MLVAERNTNSWVTCVRVPVLSEKMNRICPSSSFKATVRGLADTAPSLLIAVMYMSEPMCWLLHSRTNSKLCVTTIASTIVITSPIVQQVRDNYNLKSHKYVCITTYQPDTESNPNLNPTTKQHAIVNIHLNIVTCPTHPEKFIRDNVVAPSVLLQVVIVTLPLLNRQLQGDSSANGFVTNANSACHTLTDRQRLIHSVTPVMVFQL